MDEFSLEDMYLIQWGEENKRSHLYRKFRIHLYFFFLCWWESVAKC